MRAAAWEAQTEPGLLWPINGILEVLQFYPTILRNRRKETTSVSLSSQLQQKWRVYSFGYLGPPLHSGWESRTQGKHGIRRGAPRASPWPPVAGPLTRVPVAEG